ncbi:MAG: hypothetical protein A2W35_05670 [Chloroflexi bacterium RBG_16_57_11]|nr:MAG: hypothetical protein A2W35_05670 [Chloroflexi bacterium RBG_16_57_11]
MDIAGWLQPGGADLADPTNSALEHPKLPKLERAADQKGPTGLLLNHEMLDNGTDLLGVINREHGRAEFQADQLIAPVAQLPHLVADLLCLLVKLVDLGDIGQVSQLGTEFFQLLTQLRDLLGKAVELLLLFWG